MNQPQGQYPRVTGSDLQSGQYSNMLVSVVGKASQTNPVGPDGSSVTFETSDGSNVVLNIDQLEGGTIIAEDPSMAYEIIGAAEADGSVQVRLACCCCCCCLKSTKRGLLLDPGTNHGVCLSRQWKVAFLWA